MGLNRWSDLQRKSTVTPDAPARIEADAKAAPAEIDAAEKAQATTTEPPPQEPRTSGWTGAPFEIGEEFFEPMSEEELLLWEEGHPDDPLRNPPKKDK